MFLRVVFVDPFREYLVGCLSIMITDSQISLRGDLIPVSPPLCGKCGKFPVILVQGTGVIPVPAIGFLFPGVLWDGSCVSVGSAHMLSLMKAVIIKLPQVYSPSGATILFRHYVHAMQPF